MKEYKSLTSEETIKRYVGDNKDICYLDVEKRDESLRSFNHFIIAIEPNFTVYIFAPRNKYLILSPPEIKKIKTGFNFPFYIISGYFSSLFTMAFLAWISSEQFHFPILFAFLLFTLFIIVFAYLLTKIFYYRKIKIKTVYHTIYSYTYCCPCTSYSKKSIEISIFENRIALFQKNKHSPFTIFPKNDILKKTVYRE